MESIWLVSVRIVRFRHPARQLSEPGHAQRHVFLPLNFYGGDSVLAATRFNMCVDRRILLRRSFFATQPVTHLL